MWKQRLGGYLSEKYVHIRTWVLENVCHSNSKNKGIHILSFLKRGGVSYTWGRWKGGLFGTHFCTMSYIGYPHPEVINHLRCRIRQWFCYLRILHLLRRILSLGCKVFIQRVPGCNSIADLSLKIVFWTHKFAVGLTGMGNSEIQYP